MTENSDGPLGDEEITSPEEEEAQRPVRDGRSHQKGATRGGDREEHIRKSGGAHAPDLVPKRGKYLPLTTSAERASGDLNIDRLLTASASLVPCSPSLTPGR